MKIALFGSEFKNNYPSFNSSQIMAGIRRGAAEGTDLVCFGEAFLQGFEGLLWVYQPDTYIALKQDASVIESIRRAARENGIGVAFGYLERDGSEIYSSYMVLDRKGETLCNYRRVSAGWREKNVDLRHYREGEEFSTFDFEGRVLTVALCGDLWEDKHSAAINDLEADAVLWPVYCDYHPQDWESNGRGEYAERSSHFNKPLLWVNSICRNPMRAFGGAAVFEGGLVKAERQPDGTEGVLFYQI